jgi:hypothetical protein
LRSWFGVVSGVTMGALFALFLWTAHSVFILNITSIYAEHGLLEKIQAILLAISCIVFLMPIALEKKPEKLILLFCSLLCFSFLLRELDVKNLDIHSTLKLIGSGIGRKIILAVAFTALFSCAAFRFRYYTQVSVSFLKSKSGILFTLGGLFLIVGDLFEKRSSIIHHVFWEELFELCGYCFILLSAFAANAVSNGITRRSI